ncbi:Zinc finger mym-type protein 4-like isoform x6 [Plakobranchus ocellatus]|uniref:Zinc finger mym-type protein 4-like isoform x6 n=1 Tax=Plakobranchus ocellatus TaxID=259542 RepID=A0AAV4CJ68_9GAST|nr:Zinc finger mym-type protein 4-like isoform x6 [Plakobranchus ocellatus]
MKETLLEHEAQGHRDTPTPQVPQNPKETVPQHEAQGQRDTPTPQVPQNPKETVPQKEAQGQRDTYTPQVPQNPKEPLPKHEAEGERYTPTTQVPQDPKVTVPQKEAQAQRDRPTTQVPQNPKETLLQHEAQGQRDTPTIQVPQNPNENLPQHLAQDWRDTAAAQVRQTRKKTEPQLEAKGQRDTSKPLVTQAEKDQVTSVVDHAENEQAAIARHYVENDQTIWSQQKIGLLIAWMQVAELSLSDREILIDFLKEPISAQAAVGRHRSVSTQQHAEEDQRISADSTSRPQPYSTVRKEEKTNGAMPAEKDESIISESPLQKDHTSNDRSTADKDQIISVQTSINHNETVAPEPTQRQSLILVTQPTLLTDPLMDVQPTKTHIATHIGQIPLHKPDQEAGKVGCIDQSEQPNIRDDQAAGNSFHDETDAYDEIVEVDISPSHQSVPSNASNLSVDDAETSRCLIKSSSQTPVQEANYACDNLNAEITKIKRTPTGLVMHFSGLDSPQRENLITCLQFLTSQLKALRATEQIARAETTLTQNQTLRAQDITPRNQTAVKHDRADMTLSNKEEGKENIDKKTEIQNPTNKGRNAEPDVQSIAENLTQTDENATTPDKTYSAQIRAPLYEAHKDQNKIEKSQEVKVRVNIEEDRQVREQN